MFAPTTQNTNSGFRCGMASACLRPFMSRRTHRKPIRFLMERTPYGVEPYGSTTIRKNSIPGESFARDGFIFVYQDVRGR